MRNTRIEYKLYFLICFFILVSLGKVNSQIIIGTPNLDFSQACANADFNNYSVNFVFSPESGLQPSNQFSIELSDASGDFSNAVVVFTSNSGEIITSPAILNFSLPEVKRGLFPMQVMASLINIMPKRKVLDWCVRGYSITAKEAHSLGLLSHICSKDKIESVTNKLVEEIKENSPKAISLGLEAYDNLYNTNNEHEYLSEMLNKMQQNDDAKEGLSAFKEKRKPNWTGN